MSALNLTVGDLARTIAGAIVHGDAAVRISTVSTDSRTLKRGALFVALSGDRFDGHDYVEAARERGAAALLVQRELPIALAQIVVADTRRALGLAAAAWRARFDLPVIAVTGSNGKTSVTQMLGGILGAAFGDTKRLVTRGNLNNDIGLPLMLFELSSAHRAAALELGMNHSGEIATLAQFARPTVALVNNAHREHQEFMASIEATAHENGAAIAALPPDGVAVFPADDPCVSIWRRAAGTRRVFDFARSTAAAVTARYDLHPGGADLSIATPIGVIDVELQLSGEHNVHNALAATAAALAIGIAPPAIKAGLQAAKAVAGRGGRSKIAGGGVLIDDTYNANPDSVRAAIEVLAECRSPRMLVLGDMGEVGADGPAFHREVGAYARERRIDLLLALGEASRDTVAAFGPGGRHFEDADELIAAVRASATRQSTVLVKGSRFMRMERVVAALAQRETGKERAGAH